MRETTTYVDWAMTMLRAVLDLGDERGYLHCEARQSQLNVAPGVQTRRG